MAKPKIRHLAIKTPSPEKLAAFYQDAFEMEVLLREGSALTVEAQCADPSTEGECCWTVTGWTDADGTPIASWEEVVNKIIPYLLLF